MTYPSFSGEVIEGYKIGRKLGFPTANISTTETLPENGVYIAEIQINGQSYYGILSIGTRPTLQLSRLSVEVYILDFCKDIYHEHIKVTPLHFIRKEEKFNSTKELQEQMQEDKLFTLNWLKTYR